MVESLPAPTTGNTSICRATNRATRLSGFEGFDYVLNPGLSMNRDYVLDGAGANDYSKDVIRESIAPVVKDDSKARQMFEG